MLDEFDESGAVVVGFGDPVAAAEVEIGDFGRGEKGLKLIFYGFDRGCEVGEGLFAEGVEVKG